ncbi:hypothetical protein BKA70DRAFT_1406182 [Coprinopsis sp. MPI-PUGE-AT-0042]|nr:hypothetical protein BKA70DRAFT_1406182 [Coprinopsis sp. MPI-PUGE-AT-0042]
MSANQHKAWMKEIESQAAAENCPANAKLVVADPGCSTNANILQFKRGDHIRVEQPFRGYRLHHGQIAVDIPSGTLATINNAVYSALRREWNYTLDVQTLQTFEIMSGEAVIDIGFYSGAPEDKLRAEGGGDDSDDVSNEAGGGLEEAGGGGGGGDEGQVTSLLSVGGVRVTKGAALATTLTRYIPSETRPLIKSKSIVPLVTDGRKKLASFLSEPFQPPEGLEESELEEAKAAYGRGDTEWIRLGRTLGQV